MAFSERSWHARFEWTDERVERLKKYWDEDGYSAGQIARLLDGPSRSAVIGKIHRLGLSGRGKPRKQQLAPGHSRPTTTYRKPRRSSRPKRPEEIKHLQPQADWQKIRKELSADRQGYQTFKEVEVPPEERKGLVELEEDNCRWPIGDPKHDDFHYCNGKKAPGMQYCEFHCAVAYRPPEVRPRKPAKQKVRTFEDA